MEISLDEWVPFNYCSIGHEEDCVSYWWWSSLNNELIVLSKEEVKTDHRTFEDQNISMKKKLGRIFSYGRIGRRFISMRVIDFGSAKLLSSEGWSRPLVEDATLNLINMYPGHKIRFFDD